MPNEESSAPVALAPVPEQCPCCGRGYAAEADPANAGDCVGFDYWRGVAFKGDVRVALAPAEADLLKLIFDAWPNPVTRQALLVGMFGGTYPVNLDRRVNTLHQHLLKLKNKLRPLGLTLPYSNRRGWWLARR